MTSSWNVLFAFWTFLPMVRQASFVASSWLSDVTRSASASVTGVGDIAHDPTQSDVATNTIAIGALMCLMPAH